MSLALFLNTLFDHGHVRVPTPDRLESSDELRAATELLRDFEQSWRLEFPGEAPPLYMPAARWAATMLYRAAQGAVHREVGEDVLRNGLSVDCPPADDAAARHYSVDLTFRFLPDLVNLARRASSSDPLLEIVRPWANQWPLSSVGMKEVQPESVDAIASHAGLLQLYVDRILAREDFGRLSDDRIRAAARKAVGAYVELSPALQQHLGN